MLLVVGFIMLMPFTKFRHILTTSANYFFVDQGPKGKLTTLDLEDEAAETFGVAQISETVVPMDMKLVWAGKCTCPGWSACPGIKVGQHVFMTTI